MKKWLLVFVVILVSIIISYYTAGYFGVIYDKSFPSELNSGWIGSSGSLQFIRGISLSLIFFLTLLSYSFLFKSKSSTMWLLSPLLLWEGTFDIKHIYIPILLIIIAFGLATLLKKLFKRNSS